MPETAQALLAPFAVRNITFVANKDLLVHRAHPVVHSHFTIAGGRCKMEQYKRRKPRLPTEFNVNPARIIFLLVVVLSSSVGAAENGGEPRWPQFRGPNSSGLGGGKPPIHFGPGENVKWKTTVGSGLSSPIIGGERIILTQFDQRSQKLATLCIDRRTGNIVWRRAVTVEQIEKVHPLSSPAAATPATDGERVYVYFGKRQESLAGSS